MKIIPGHTALITGAAGGLGSALAEALAERGCHLALADINSSALASLAERLRRPGLLISCHSIDLRGEQAAVQLAHAISKQHGQLQLVINNAGITLQKSVETHSESDWQRVFDLNFWAAVRCSRALLPLLRAGGGGHIVNISSMAACYGMPSQSSYSSSKAALRAFSESLRSELAVDNIGVSSIHPGAIKTNMIKATLAESDDIEQAQTHMALAQRFGISPDKAAQKILAAISRNQAQRYIGLDAKLYRTVSKCCPALLSFALAKSYQRIHQRHASRPAH